MPYNEQFLREAIRLSKEKMEAGCGGPFGAVIIQNGDIVGRGWNQVTSSHDPTAHAEVSAIRDACQNLKTFSLTGCEIYSSCEPCPMCLSAIYWSRLDALYFAGSQNDAADAGFDDAFLYKEVALNREHRSLPSSQHLQQDAQAVFALWKSKEDRIDY